MIPILNYTTMKVTIKELDRYIAGELNGEERALIEQQLMADEKLFRLFHLMINIDEAIGSLDEIEMRHVIKNLMQTHDVWPDSRKQKIST